MASSSSSLIKPQNLPTDVLIEEETCPNYNAADYYPMDPQQLLHERYRMVTKLGWGRCSTVWLAQDIQRGKWWKRQSNQYVVVKVGTCRYGTQDATKHESNISLDIAKQNPSHEGFQYVRTAIDNFTIRGADGLHICLVYEPMREPLWQFQRRCKDGRLTVDLLKGYLGLLLKALDYLHSECRVIHTDLKLDNILVGFEDSSVVHDFAQKQATNPMARKIQDDRTIYESHNDFGPIRAFYLLPKIADFGLAQRGKDPLPLAHPIQPDYYRAPEVILGAGWSYSADIWNLGVLIWNMMENKELFTSLHSSQGEYDCRAHLAQMIAFLGSPPKELLDRAGKWSWSPAIENSTGKLCTTATEFYGGPFFGSGGEFLHMNLIPNKLSLADTVTSLDGDDKELFLDFITGMLQWLPGNRKTAKELLNHPWLRMPVVNK